MATSASDGPTPLGLALLAEAFAGAVIGAVFVPLFGFGIALVLSWTPWAQQLGMGLLAVQLYAAIFGFGIGAAIGIWLVGRFLRQNGSLGMALAAAVVSMVLGIVIVQLFGIGGNAPLTFALLGIVPLVLALLGYNLRRRPA